MHLPVRDIDLDHIAFFHQADRAAFGRFRRRMSDHQTRRAARKTTVREQRARLTQTLGLQRITTTSPGCTSSARMPATAASWLS
ncbi:hypothetical protein G6F40_017725 [Rhizopus arrhizus]|uniref:Uncharacterized protein n=1 Tax=Rhizopus delemar TaxID=936053 RepID=A0A9P6XNA3_9FUNG|nr:hypothetical protein G6F40_017725 [Rhizopus arrhizus]KAG1525833.1 hypothetical protein G6F50_018431 [Rhizopus delemar]